MTGKTRGKGDNWDTRRNPFQNNKPTGNAPQLADVPYALSAMDKVLSAGCAVLIGHTRDGGALVLTILDGDQRHRTYCSNHDELDAAITSMAFVYEAQ